MALSPHSLLREQSEFVNSPFTRMHEKVLYLKTKQTSSQIKVTNQKLKDYLERLSELSSEVPDRAPFFYDLLQHETKIYVDQIVCKL